MEGRRFYFVLMREDGLADVFLDPFDWPEPWDGVSDRQVAFVAVKGVDPEAYGGAEGLENDVRARFGDWLASGEAVQM